MPLHFQPSPESVDREPLLTEPFAKAWAAGRAGDASGTARRGLPDQTSASRATAHAMFTSRLKRLSAGKLAPGVAGRTLAQRPAIG
ncbi:hypothetical protein [Candidatus Accumulibacter vicinus]|uniref:Uncharacterized protein n=1 Tax=Candidatus Accumulibacter vicinus TaxID=2954382 RepID=A0A084XY30_9PROT|nr:hypothetical protein [Candidatus Accumulibacter vicinus]KFB67374.1 MAG: hypothetical protein CAPSK01_003242 [Candidatus Accumulibacter vicinus]